MARGRGKRARPRGRGAGNGGRLARSKKARLAQPQPSPPPPASPARDPAADALALLAAQLQSCGDARALPPPSLLQETALAVRTHGAARVLSAVPFAPRIVMHAVERGGDPASVSAAIAAFACSQGDDSVSQRARAWGARIAAGMARGERGRGVSSAFAHGAREGIAVAPRDRIDGAAVALAGRQLARSLAGSPSAERVRRAGEAIGRAARFVPTEAVSAVLEAGLRAPATLAGTDDAPLAASLRDELLPAKGPRLFDELPIAARTALLASDAHAHAAEVDGLHAELGGRLFRSLEEEEEIARPAGAAAAHDPHLHWEAMDKAMAAGPTHPLARRAWEGRVGHRALLGAMGRAAEEDDDTPGLALRLPRSHRAAARSLVALATSAMASRTAAGAAARMLRVTVASADGDSARLMHACEHALELLAVAAGADGKDLAETLGAGQYGLRAAFLAGVVAGGGHLDRAALQREAKDPIAGSELARGLMLARKYAAWADADGLRRCAGELLRECRQVHRSDRTALSHIDDLSVWWARR